MSEEIYDTEATEPDFGQAVGDEELGELENIEFLPIDEYADKYVKVVVDGEEVEVPLKEALSGYQRQADYTRKTQELSEQRKQVQFASAIQQALDNDPLQTIELLKGHYGINQATDDFEEDDLFIDPMEKQYKQLESRLRSFEERQAYEELERTINSLQTKYGEDFDANEVVSVALAQGRTDIEAVYKQIAFDRLFQQKAVSQKVIDEQQRKQGAVVSSKRQNSVVSGASPAKSTSQDNGPITSLRDAFSAAKNQLGIS